MTANQWQWTDYKSTTVTSGGATAPSPGSSETWTVSGSSGFPAANNASSPLVVFDVVDPQIPTESIRVTNVSGTTWTVTRGADSTTPVAHSNGFTVWLTTSAGALGNMVQSGNAASLGATTVSGGLTTDTLHTTGLATTSDGISNTNGINTDSLTASGAVDAAVLQATSASGAQTGAASFVASDLTNFFPQGVDGDGINYDLTRITRNGTGPQTINTTAYTTIGGLGCQVQNGATYIVTGQIYINNFTGTGNVQFRIDGTCTVSGIRISWIDYVNDATGGTNVNPNTTTGVGSGNNCTLIGPSGAGIGVESIIQVQGSFTVSAQGSFLIKAAVTGGATYQIAAYGTYLSVFPCTA